MESDSILLMGPLAAGKSSIGLELSKRLNLKNYPIDRLKWYYRFKNGYDLSRGTELLRSKGFKSLIEYTKQYFGIDEIKEILNNFKGILDLGATDTYCITLKEFAQLYLLFKPYKNSFLILPSEDDDKTEFILNQRLLQRYERHPFKEEVLDSYLNMNKEFIKHSVLNVFANHIIYVNDRTIDQVCYEIESKLILSDQTNVYRNYIN